MDSSSRINLELHANQLYLNKISKLYKKQFMHVLVETLTNSGLLIPIQYHRQKENMEHFSPGQERASTLPSKYLPEK